MEIFIIYSLKILYLLNTLYSMKNFILSFALTALLTFSEISFGAPRNYNAPTKCKKWFASWCTPPDSTRTGREVLLFRRTFQLSEKPGSFVINVSADNRFRLFVNGVSVAVGPARGDLEHWRYDTLDIGGHLKKGKNSIAAIVWNYASQAPIAQITFESGFVLDGATKAEEFVATPAGWKAKKSEAFSDAENRCAMYTGPGEKLDASKYDRGWTLPDFDDSAWPDAVKTRDALSPAGRDGENAGWSLIPREIPQLEETPARFSKIRKFSGSGKPADFINGEKFTLPANSEYSIIIDNGTLTNAYPCLITNRGAGSEIKVAYAEALYDERGLKGDGNSVEGRHFRTPMPSDIFLPDGGPFEFSTLWWRTWRYVRLDIKTANEPLDIEDFYRIFTRYPFREEGYFKSSDASAGKRCYDESRGLFMNYAGSARSSQHANIMGILSGAAEPGERRALIGKILSDPALDQCTLYYRFYLAEAMRMAGEGDKYFSQLEPWKKMLDRGLTTFAEKPDPTRSDCHAWSSYHLLSLVCGVTPAEYGFKSVRIEPKLGQLKFVEAAIPHPKGKIRISLKKKGEEIGGFVELPEGLSGTFADGKRDYPVKGGFNRIGRD